MSSREAAGRVTAMAAAAGGAVSLNAGYWVIALVCAGIIIGSILYLERLDRRNKG